MNLSSHDLVSKWGFHDGDMPDDVYDELERRGIAFASVDWHATLEVLVYRYLVPRFDCTVEVTRLHTHHNPMRATAIAGQDVRWAWAQHDADVPDVDLDVSLDQIIDALVLTDS
jgi:hypothetical protein